MNKQLHNCSCILFHSDDAITYYYTLSILLYYYNFILRIINHNQTYPRCNYATIRRVSKLGGSSL